MKFDATAWTSLLADSQTLRSAGDKLRGNGSQFGAGDLAIWAAAAAGVALVAWVILLYSRYRERHRTIDDPRRLFHELCRRHDLPRTDVSILKGLAAERGLSEPALLFVGVEQFAPSNLPAEWDAHLADLERLRDTLFGEVPAVQAASGAR